MMKKILLTFLLLISCTCTLVYADTQQFLPGGYVPVDQKDKDLQDVIKFAVTTMQQGSLVKVISAEKQVVAGTNYALQLEIAASDGTNHIYNVIVFVPLPDANQSMQLTTMQDTGPMASATENSGGNQ
jgi:hypothetical protein